MSGRVEQIGNATLYLADCADILADLAKTDVKTIITSPPYNLGVSPGGGFPRSHGHYDPEGGYRGRGGSGKWAAAGIIGGLADGYGEHDDKMDFEKYEEWQRSILVACWNTLADDGAIFYNHKPRPTRSELWLPTRLNPELPLRQIVIWARAGGINFAPTHYVPTHEWIMVLAKPAFRLRDKAASGAGDVWYIPQEGATEHPAPFPVEIPSRVLQTTNPGVVLDPFMGSGSTGVAAAKYHRPFIGIELNPTYFDIACRRIEQAQRQSDLFVDQPAPPPRWSQDTMAL